MDWSYVLKYQFKQDFDEMGLFSMRDHELADIHTFKKKWKSKNSDSSLSGLAGQFRVGNIVSTLYI